MAANERISARAARWILSAIVIGASALALRWAFIVPIFQAPDEHQHLDYALSLRDGGHFFRAVPLGANPNEFSHPWMKYLAEKTESDSVMFNTAARVPAKYGTRAYLRAIDRGAPPLSSVTISQPPSLAVVYPYGYYAFLAGWLKLVGLFSGRVTVTFFAARVLSVALLAVSLVAGYLAAREVRVGRGAALLATAIVGFFPMTTFVASYVQPDNLTFTLVSLGLYLGLRTARRNGRVPDLAFLGLVWGTLLVTKPHFFACLVATTAPLIALKVRPRRWPLAAALLAWPSIPLWWIFAWIVQDVPLYYSQVAAMPDPVINLVDRLNRCFYDFFFSTTHMTFWGVFGWIDTPLELGTPVRLVVLMRFLATAGTWVMIALFGLRLQQNASRIARVAIKGRWRAAALAAVSDPVANIFFLFFALMVYAYVRMDNRFGAQGRNWVPVMLPIVLLTIRFGPRALSGRWWRRLASATLAAGLVAYVSLGSYYALRTVQKRYYLPKDHYVTRQISVPTTPVALHRMTGEGSGWSWQAPDSALTFALPSPEHARFVELRFVLNSYDRHRAVFRVSAINSRGPQPPPPTSLKAFSLPTRPGERRVIIPVNEKIDTIRIDPDTQPCWIEVRSITVSQPIRRLAAR